MQRLLIVALLSLLAAGMGLGLFTSQFGQRIELAALDRWFNLRGQVAPPDDIVVVSIDEQSYSVLGLPMNRSWPRATHAELLRRLAEMGARRVLFDVLFLGSSDDPEADKALAEALGGLPAVLGVDLVTKEMAYEGGAIAISELERPFAPLEERAAGLGLVGVPEDEGYVRRFNVERSEQSEGIQTLAQAASEVAWDAPDQPSERDLINYYGPSHTIRTIPYVQVLETAKPIDPAKIRGKTVFVGLNLRTELGPAQKDSYLTPFDSKGRIFGVEIHATMAANLQRHDWIRRLSPGYEVAIVASLAFVFALAVFSLGPIWAGIVLVLAVAVWAVGAFLAFRSGFFLPGATICLVILPFSYVGSTLFYYLTTKKSNQQLKKAFELYLSPSMAEEIARNPTAIQLGGEGAYATAVFTDIAGFTSISEGMLPQQVTQMLNAYFTEVMGVIFDNEGTLIKFIGDAVFCLFGVPIKSPDHAARACRTALEIQKQVEQFNASGRFPPLHTRIGIHTGPMVVGNLGAAQRFDYTAIGDSVNLASRIEGLNKYFGTNVMITEEVRQNLKSGFHLLEIGTIKVAGKSKSVPIHTVIEQPVAAPARESWERALRAFRLRRWKESQEVFLELAKSEAWLAKSAHIYLGQIGMHKAEEPGDSWNGELVFTEK